MCVGKLVTDDDNNDDRQFMIAWALWHSTNEPKTAHADKDKCLKEVQNSNSRKID